jgi:plasmid maintenance system killer protein
MEVTVPNNRLRRDIEDAAARKKRFGKDMAQKIALRRAALVAAESLADFWPPHSGPERVHELKKGDLLGTFSMDLKHPFRLLFNAIGLEKKEPGVDEKKRWESVKSVEIISVEDTHG